MQSFNAGGKLPKITSLNIKHDGKIHRDVLTKVTQPFPKFVRDRAIELDRKTSGETWDLDKWEKYMRRDLSRSKEHLELAGGVVIGIGLLKHGIQ